MNLRTVDPSTGADLALYEPFDDGRIATALDRADAAAGEWRGRRPAARAEVVRGLADRLRADPAPIARLITREMGKPIAEAEAEVVKSAATAEWYATNGPALLADELVRVAGGEAWVAYEPIGLVLAIMPWNFPLWQVIRAVVPAVTAGNGVLLKHSPNVTGCALAIERLFRDAGFPEHLLTALVVDEARVPGVTRTLIADARVAGVTLTGSDRAGAAVGAFAGAAAKPSVLELGGSDAFVVLDDADVPAAAAAAVRSRFVNCGQSCVSAKRFIVDSRVAAQFTREVVDLVGRLAVGDPQAPGTTLGPLARADLREQIDTQVRASVEAGAELLAGGHALPGPGWFYQPTVLGEVRPGMPAFDDETFGPVATITVARGDDEAVELADASRYGLGVSVWSRSTARAVGVARRITTGAAFINAIVASDPRVPFGGTKASGHGRELAGPGLRAFVNVRTFWVAS